LGLIVNIQCLVINPIQCSDQVGEEANQVIVSFVEGEPGRQPIGAVQPSADQCGFAVAESGLHALKLSGVKWPQKSPN